MKQEITIKPAVSGLKTYADTQTHTHRDQRGEEWGCHTAWGGSAVSTTLRGWGR